MKIISLTKSVFTKVDDCHYERLVNMATWKLLDDGYNRYAFCHLSGRTALMHHCVVGAPPDGFEWDHKDGDGLNNQEENLRLCSHSNNLANRGPQRNNKSGYKGVSWFPLTNKWQWYVRKKGKRVAGGYVDTIEEAALAYNEAAKEHFGEFAFQNDVSKPLFSRDFIDSLLGVNSDSPTEDVKTEDSSPSRIGSPHSDSANDTGSQPECSAAEIDKLLE